VRDFTASFFTKKQKETKYLFLGVGVVLLFSLIYLLFSALFSVVSSPERDSKNQLIRAQELIESSQKIINNPTAFNKTIEEAEVILFELRDKRVYMSDTQSLLSRIEAMKKEVNDVQTIDVSKLNPVMSI
jgi:3-methyladenine DNA glycosylase Mpg